MILDFRYTPLIVRSEPCPPGQHRRSRLWPAHRMSPCPKPLLAGPRRWRGHRIPALALGIAPDIRTCDVRMLDQAPEGVGQPGHCGQVGSLAQRIGDVRALPQTRPPAQHADLHDKTTDQFVHIHPIRIAEDPLVCHRSRAECRQGRLTRCILMPLPSVALRHGNHLARSWEACVRSG